MKQVAIAFLAHPDDAEILCGGTLVLLKARGWTIHIATAKVTWNAAVPTRGSARGEMSPTAMGPSSPIKSHERASGEKNRRMPRDESGGAVSSGTCAATRTPERYLGGPAAVRVEREGNAQRTHREREGEKPMTMGTKIRERATGEQWTIVADGEGRSLVAGMNEPKEVPKSYRIRNETTGEERLIAYDFGARYELQS